MATTILTVWDKRLTGNFSLGAEVLAVDESTPMAKIVHWIALKGKEFENDFTLVTILAHGYEPVAPGGLIVPDGLKNPKQKGVYATYYQGGGGIQLGRDDLSISTIGSFHSMAGTVDWIDILSCGAAYIVPRSSGGYGDGNFLCYRFAQITQATIRASTATQWYDPGKGSMGGWEGTVITWDKTGTPIKSESFPSNTLNP